MIETANFSNNDSGNYDFNDDFNPISDFDVTVDMRTDKTRIIPQGHGVYPTPTYRDGMTIDIGGNILADDYGDYVDKRKNLVHALFGDNFTGLVSENQLGTLTMFFTGQEEGWSTLCTIDAFSAPKTWSEGAYSPYLVTFYSWNPYFYGSDDNTNLYRWA